jgi:cation-transporting P-type ATPase E
MDDPEAGGEPDPASSLGISEQEAQRRLRERGRRSKPPSSRSYATIVRSNLFTLPNVVLGVLGIATVALGELADALFLGIVVANAVIGSVQEIRAKRALERLAALVRPEARVIRDGRERPLPAAEVVEGDLVRLQPGDQVTADGRVEAADGLRIDESILTGESRAVVRAAGEEVLSGSFSVEGTGLYTVTAVGAESYAEKLAGEARAFRHPPSPFQVGLGRLIVFLVLLALPLGLALSLSLWLRETSFDAALPTVVAAGINLVPEGLILLSSIVYVTGALRMSRHGALVQQLNAVESLASADIVCTDKTGTLTESRLRVVDLVPATDGGGEELVRSVGRYAAAAEVRNPTVDALAAAVPAPSERASASIPFSSRWKWSAVQLGESSYVLGAPELFVLGNLAARAGTEAEEGRRVVALAVTERRLAGLDPSAGPPASARLLGIVTLSEQLRPNARETVSYLLRERVELKVVSGDAAPTVAAIAADAGIPSRAPPVDGRELPQSTEELQALMERTAVVGRISPEGKRRIVEALRDAGRYVAMVGDGVNDVPALKASRIAIAQGSGSQMARTVSDLVLVKGDFGAVPRMVAEGRQILRNLQRVSKIYTAKALFGALIVLGIGLAPIPYPFLPRHLSLASFFVTGVPTFFLALAPSSGPWRMTSYVKDVVRFAVPAAASIALGVIVAYVLSLEALDLGLDASRTVALSVFVAGSLAMIFALEATSPRRARWVGLLCLVLLVAYGLVFAIPPIRELFSIVVPDGEALGMIVLGTGITSAALTAFGIRPLAGASERSATGT